MQARYTLYMALNFDTFSYNACIISHYFYIHSSTQTIRSSKSIKEKNINKKIDVLRLSIVYSDIFICIITCNGSILSQEPLWNFKIKDQIFDITNNWWFWYFYIWYSSKSRHLLYNIYLPFHLITFAKIFLVKWQT